MFEKLNLPEYKAKTKEGNGKVKIFDFIRKKYVVLTPEEWVRQHFINYLIVEKQYPASLMAVETGLKYNRLQKRSDIVIYNTFGKPHLLVECKAPEIKITQDTFDQIARYNFNLRVKYLIVTNGMTHFCCEMDYEKEQYTYLQKIPRY